MNLAQHITVELFLFFSSPYANKILEIQEKLN